MADKKPKLPTIVSPSGLFAFAWIAKADTEAKGNFKPDGKYKVTLVLPKENAENQDEVDKFVKTINVEHGKVTKASKTKKKADSPVKDGDEIADQAKENGKDKEEFRGKYLVTFKSKYQPKCVDAKRGELTADQVRSGDVGKVAYAIVPFDSGNNQVGVGVSLQLRAVQLLEKNATGADYSGVFGEEDGFVGEPTAEGGTGAEAF